MFNEVSSEDKVKIRGWLIVVGVYLWLGVSFACLNILFGLTTTHNATQSELLINGVVNIILLFPMVVMFHRRRAFIVWWSVVYGIYAVIYECYIQYHQIITHSSSITIAGHIVAVILEALLMTGVVMYFFKSKRVKRTFVR